jgi:hypothetical protein
VIQILSSCRRVLIDFSLLCTHEDILHAIEGECYCFVPSTSNRDFSLPLTLPLQTSIMLISREMNLIMLRWKRMLPDAGMVSGGKGKDFGTWELSRNEGFDLPKGFWGDKGKGQFTIFISRFGRRLRPHEFSINFQHLRLSNPTIFESSNSTTRLNVSFQSKCFELKSHKLPSLNYLHWLKAGFLPLLPK